MSNSSYSFFLVFFFFNICLKCDLWVYPKLLKCLCYSIYVMVSIKLKMDQWSGVIIGNLYNQYQLVYD